MSKIHLMTKNRISGRIAFMLIKLALKNIFSRKSSIVIILFIAFAIMLFCVANAVFDTTEQGIEQSYISSFTGDFIIRPQNNGQQTSLFGDEAPATGELTKNELLVPYSDIEKYLSADTDIKALTGQVSGYAMAEVNGIREPLYLFGVTPEEYFPLMTSLKLQEGSLFKDEEKGVLLYKKIADKLKVKTGDEVQFTVVDGISARIRVATVTGIYNFENENSIFERYALISPDVLRSLLDITETVSDDYYIPEENDYLLEIDDLDSLFNDAEDTDAVFSEAVEMEEHDNYESTEVSANTSTAWNFIVCRAQDSSSTKKIISRLNRDFHKNGWPVEAVAWRNAAGSTALYLYWMRIILNVGIIVILIAGFIIINNTLVVNILDRSREIGTLRAIGAKQSFISLECMTETTVLAIVGGILGILFGIAVAFLITKAHIKLGNSFLIQLFGSQALVVKVTSGNILKLLAASVAIGALGWIYPVRTALKINPVQAMQGAK